MGIARGEKQPGHHRQAKRSREAPGKTRRLKTARLGNLIQIRQILEFETSIKNYIKKKNLIPWA
jgi:hypothetical protein